MVIFPPPKYELHKQYHFDTSWLSPMLTRARDRARARARVVKSCGLLYY